MRQQVVQRDRSPFFGDVKVREIRIHTPVQVESPVLHKLECGSGGNRFGNGGQAESRPIRVHAALRRQLGSPITSRYSDFPRGDEHEDQTGDAPAWHFSGEELVREPRDTG